MKIVGIIPARYGSSRFPGKPLFLLHNKPMIQWVYEQAKKATRLTDVAVATDDERIREAVIKFGGNVILTSDKHLTGTDRINEAVQKLPDSYDAVINIQGDEPAIEPENIDLLCQLISQEHVKIGTLCRPLVNRKYLLDSNKIKVVLTKKNKALYFSRSPIPYFRDPLTCTDNALKQDCYLHIGIYAFKTDVLKYICDLPTGFLEHVESLEQLRWLQNDIDVYTKITHTHSFGVDSPEDIEPILALLK